MRSVRALSLTTLMMLSLMAALVTVPTAAAVNETTDGYISGTETWSGSITLTGDVNVTEGSKLIINAGTTVTIPQGRYIYVQGALCAGDSSCGATQGSSGSQVRFVWSNNVGLTGATTSTRCVNPNVNLYNVDLGCGEAVVFAQTIDEDETGLSYVTFQDGYGFPAYVPSEQAISYGVLVLNGASPVLDHLTFSGSNTSDVLAYNQAAPVISDSTFANGDDAREYGGSAILAFNAGGSASRPFVIRDSDLTGIPVDDCGQNGGGKGTIYASNSLIQADNLDISNSAYGLFLGQTSGSIRNSTIDVGCNGIDTNGRKEIGTTVFTLNIDDNDITTENGAPITAYDLAIIDAKRNVVEGAAQGSGIAVRNAVATLTGNTIGPIGGFNGLWILGASDVIAENNTITGTTMEPIIVGEYHVGDSGWNVPNPNRGRAYLGNNTITGAAGSCSSGVYSYLHTGPGAAPTAFPCPSVHAFMTSVTMIGNTINHTGGGDALRFAGVIANVQDNTISSDGFGTRIAHYDNNYGVKYGSIAFFSGNTWSGQTQVYNITESRVAVQSEFIPDPSASNVSHPIQMQWLGAECPYVQSECLQVPPTSVMPPMDMPLALSLTANSSSFTFADLQNFDISKIHVQNQNSAWGSLVERGELVRIRVLSTGNSVAGADVEVRNANGEVLYNLVTDAYGYTPRISLPSNFHIDRNWNHIANDAGENSCTDGIDNDGDTLADDADPDCDGTNREMAKYRITSSKFGKGEHTYEITLTGAVDDTVQLQNLAPTVNIDQPDGYPFARTVALTGSSFDGIAGPYASDNEARDGAFGIVQRVEILPDGYNDWSEARYATDTSGSNGEVTQQNHPFRTWSFDWDMSGESERDVSFQVRAFDGVSYSPAIVRQYKLNIDPPSVLVTTPADRSAHVDGSVRFTGTASDAYSGVQGSDIDRVFFRISGPAGYSLTTSTDGSEAWTYDWDFSSLESGEYTFEIWASDSNYCRDDSMGCEDRIVRRTLTIDTTNRAPNLQFTGLESDIENPVRVRASSDSVLSGFTSDIDGSVTRIEFTLTDLQNGQTRTELDDDLRGDLVASNGSWSRTWDSSRLIHDYVYRIDARAWDGEAYSPMASAWIIIEDPPNAGNTRPTFNGLEWPETVRLFCTENSVSFDACGNGATIQLTDFFSDAEDELDGFNFEVLDNDGTVPLYPQIILIDSDGTARYNPVELRDPAATDISDWSLLDVRFRVTDEGGLNEVSLQTNFIVEPVTFQSNQSGTSVTLEEGERQVFTGRGLPGSRVEAKIGERVLNSTIVGADATWSMAVSSYMIQNDDAVFLTFEQDGQVLENGVSVQVGNSDSGGLSLIMIILIIIVGIVALGGIAVFFFVEVETYDEDVMEAEAPAEAVDPYAWAKKSVPVLESASNMSQQPQPVSENQHPGWIWDAASNQWVADPNYQPSE